MEELLQELFARYQRDVYRYLYHLSRDAALSEELTAETFLEVVQSIHRFRSSSPTPLWETPSPTSWQAATPPPILRSTMATRIIPSTL